MNVPGAGGVLARIAWGAVAIVAVAAGIAFSVVFMAVGLVVGAIAWAWLAWKRRTLRGPAGAPTPGRVIEGEAVSLPDEPR
jgi:hypothetical protein